MKPIHVALKQLTDHGLVNDEHWGLFIADARVERAQDVVYLSATRDAFATRNNQLLRAACQRNGRHHPPAARQVLFA